MSDSKVNFFRRMLKERFRITFFHDDFKPVFSMRFTIFSLLLWIVGYAVLVIVIAIFIISKTSLKEYIPGYATNEQKKQIIALNNKIDSLQTVFNNKNIYVKAILDAINGTTDTSALQKTKKIPTKTDKYNIKAGQNELSLRKEIENEWATNKTSIASSISDEDVERFKFVLPTEGFLISQYNPAVGHNGIDVVTKNEAPVRSIDKGIIISSGYSITDGNFVIIAHPSGFVSVYKHLSIIFKNTGTIVNSGDIIANSGNTGSESNGVHLHFELWYKNKLVNPQDYILF